MTDLEQQLADSLRLVAAGKAACGSCAELRAERDELRALLAAREDQLNEAAEHIRFARNERDAARDLLRATQAQLERERETVHVIPARETLPVSDPANDIALLDAWKRDQAEYAAALALGSCETADNDERPCSTCEGGGRVIDGDDNETRCQDCRGDE